MRGRWSWLILAGLVLLVMGKGIVGGIGDALISAIANGIALAEGFFVAGSRPARNHNPGDLTQDLTGKSIGWDGPFVVYSSDADGWEALQKQVALMFEGSHVYNPNMTINQISVLWTTTDQVAWARTVAGALGVSTDTTLAELAGIGG